MSKDNQSKYNNSPKVQKTNQKTSEEQAKHRLFTNAPEDSNVVIDHTRNNAAIESLLAPLNFKITKPKTIGHIKTRAASSKGNSFRNFVLRTSANQLRAMKVINAAYRQDIKLLEDAITNGSSNPKDFTFNITLEKPSIQSVNIFDYARSAAILFGNYNFINEATKIGEDSKYSTKVNLDKSEKKSYYANNLGLFFPKFIANLKKNINLEKKVVTDIFEGLNFRICTQPAVDLMTRLLEDCNQKQPSNSKELNIDALNLIIEISKDLTIGFAEDRGTANLYIQLNKLDKKHLINETAEINKTAVISETSFKELVKRKSDRNKNDSDKAKVNRVDSLSSLSKTSAHNSNSKTREEEVSNIGLKKSSSLASLQEDAEENKSTTYYQAKSHSTSKTEPTV